MITSPALPWTALDCPGVDCRCRGTHPPIHCPMKALPTPRVTCHTFGPRNGLGPKCLLTLMSLFTACCTVGGGRECGGGCRRSLSASEPLEDEPRLHSLLLLLLFAARDLHNSKHRMHTHQSASPPRPGTDKRPARLCPVQRQI